MVKKKRSLYFYKKNRFLFLKVLQYLCKGKSFIEHVQRVDWNVYAMQKRFAVRNCGLFHVTTVCPILYPASPLSLSLSLSFSQSVLQLIQSPIHLSQVYWVWAVTSLLSQRRCNTQHRNQQSILFVCSLFIFLRSVCCLIYAQRAKFFKINV